MCVCIKQLRHFDLSISSEPSWQSGLSATSRAEQSSREWQKRALSTHSILRDLIAEDNVIWLWVVCLPVCKCSSIIQVCKYIFKFKPILCWTTEKYGLGICRKVQWNYLVAIPSQSISETYEQKWSNGKGCGEPLWLRLWVLQRHVKCVRDDDEDRAGKTTDRLSLYECSG